MEYAGNFPACYQIFLPFINKYMPAKPFNYIFPCQSPKKIKLLTLIWKRLFFDRFSCLILDLSCGSHTILIRDLSCGSHPILILDLSCDSHPILILDLSCGSHPILILDLSCDQHPILFAIYHTANTDDSADDFVLRQQKIPIFPFINEFFTLTLQLRNDYLLLMLCLH